jgi:hypothetical protein
VHVRLEDVPDVQVVGVREANELVDVAGRIDDSGLAGPLVRNKVRRDRQAGNETLME